MIGTKWAVLGLSVAAACSVQSEVAVDPEPTRRALDGLRFLEAGAVFSLEEASGLNLKKLRVFDPNRDGMAEYLGHPMAQVLNRGFPSATRPDADCTVRAADGYVKSLPCARLKEGFLAVGEAGRAGFSPLSNGIDPGPLYLVWSETGGDSGPWIWSVTTIERGPPGSLSRALRASASLSAQAEAGFELFLHRCAGCHALNRVGGRVGPELNVPKNITEYRSEDYLRSFIRNPAAFRAGSPMPAHPDLSNSDLDRLLAYLRQMARFKVGSERPLP